MLNKKWLALLLLAVLACSLTACGEKKENMLWTPAVPQATATNVPGQNVQATVMPLPSQAPVVTAAPGNTIIGMWTVDVQATLQANHFSQEDAQRAGNGLSELNQTYQFFQNGKVISYYTVYGENRTSEFTYTMNGNQIIMGTDPSITFTFDGYRITMRADDFVTIFVRK